jgi:acyl-CoA thioesterase FadM
LLAEGETDWVFVDLQTGRPRSVPESIQLLFTSAGAADDKKEGAKDGD